jgi:hypothetical protein
LNRLAHPQHRIIASRLGDSYVGRAQSARDDCMRLLGSQSLGKPFPIAFTRRHGRTPYTDRRPGTFNRIETH